MKNLHSEVDFSVIMPCYKAAGTIGKAIESVLAQTYGDFELIVVDDASPDESVDVVRAIAAGDERVRLVEHASNRGASAARNTGIDDARGRFIAFLDADDKWMPTHLETGRRLLDSLSEAGRNSAVVFGRVQHKTEAGTKNIPSRAPAMSEDLREYIVFERGLVHMNTVIVSHQLAQQVRFDEDLIWAQDTDFACRLYSLNAKFHYTDEVTAVWDVRGDGHVSKSPRYKEMVRPILGMGHLSLRQRARLLAQRVGYRASMNGSMFGPALVIGGFALRVLGMRETLSGLKLFALSSR